MLKSKARRGTCAYCGLHRQVEKEHVVGRNLFADSIRPGLQLITVKACRECNASFSSDEEDFRNFCALAGPDNEQVREVFHGKIVRSIHATKGKGSFERLLDKILFQKEGGKNIAWITPDESVFRIVRKIARGLTYHHLRQIVSDDQVHAEAFQNEIPEWIQEGDDLFYQLHPSTFRYHFELDDSGLMNVGWIISIYRTRNFLVRIFRTSQDRDNWVDKQQVRR